MASYPIFYGEVVRLAISRLDQELSVEEKRAISQARARELRARIQDYLDARDRIPTGFTWAERINQAKRRVQAYLKGTDENWRDWRWQMRHRIRTVEALAGVTGLQPGELQDVEEVGRSYRWAISPYYAALVAAAGPGSPVWMQSVPSIEEVRHAEGKSDPMGEEFTSPVAGITRRYPDRLIINVTNMCGMYCRHCQRRRNIGECDRHQTREVLEAALEYIRSHPEIRDVLVTGGDALLLSNATLDWLFGELHAIEHVEIKRLGTRTIVTLPQRVDDDLCDILAKYPPIYINTQFNHPLEVTEEAKQACDRLIRAGVVLGNQAVLLRGVNNDPFVMRKLNQELLKVRVRPYYIFHAKQVVGTGHFITSVDEGLRVMEALRGFTSGLAVPTYIINAPDGYGKVPVAPGTAAVEKGSKVLLKTWEKRLIPYPNKEAF